MNRTRWLLAGSLLFALLGVACAAEFENLAPQAQAYRGSHPVTAQPDGLVIAEAEEFTPVASQEADSPAGWRAGNWGENYYAATFANTFLSRKAFLGVPAQVQSAQAATITVEVPAAGRYLALVRYEAAYRFETQFRLKVEQGGQVKLDRLYGARDNVKIWAFKGGGEGAVAGQGSLQKEIAWGWGAVENVVWEGHEAGVDLEVGPATLTLIADQQPEPAARRNVDLVMLTRDIDDVKQRIAREGYLPLDGLLTQAGDVMVRVINAGPAALTVTVPKCTEHSPYWVHLRTWKPVKIEVAAGATSDWVEVGSLLDSLNDGQWTLTSNQKDQGWTAQFAVRDAAGGLKPIATFEAAGPVLELAYDANTRYSQRIRRADDVLYDLLAYLKQQPSPGAPPQQTIVYGYSFTPRPGNAKYNTAREEFLQMFSLQTRLDGSTMWNGQPVGYVDVRQLHGEKLEAKLQELTDQGGAEAVRTVSLGDEIGLAAPRGDVNEAFRTWAKERGLSPAQIDANAGDDWSKVNYAPGAEVAEQNPRLYYQSRLFLHQYGIEDLKTRTQLIQQKLPNAEVGANYSPHAGAAYLGEAYQWISVFRQGGMTLPWSEDYTWQVPIGSPQMTMILLDLMRAGNRYHPDREMLFYVMPHWPGNTVRSWRRNFFGAVGHGATILNLFEFRPVQAAYTENHVSLPEMFQEVRTSLAQLAKFEDIVQSGRVRAGEAGLWYSEAGDAWHNHRAPLATGKRTLYVAVRQQQLGVEIVDEDDALRGSLKDMKVLYLTDPNVSEAASQAIAQWVESGGQLFATAGAGMLNEFNQPNAVMMALMGVKQTALEEDPRVKIRLGKQDLPFAQPMETVRWQNVEGVQVTLPAFGLLSRVEAGPDVTVQATFGDGAPAVTQRNVGKGAATYCAFLPGLSYFKPAIPQIPLDRGSTDNAMAHLLPTQFDTAAGDLVGAPAMGVARVVKTNVPTVEATVIDSPAGSAVVLVNWSPEPARDVKVWLTGEVPMKSVSRATGGNVTRSQEAGTHVFTLDELDTADAIILR